MGLQQVGKKNLRRVAEGVGEDVVQAAIGSDGVWFVFTTAAHRHGYWNRRTGAIKWLPDDEHRTSCREHFPESLARIEKVKH